VIYCGNVLICWNVVVTIIIFETKIICLSDVLWAGNKSGPPF
jgi:hypothetical protein